jgi:hypothetical protein
MASRLRFPRRPAMRSRTVARMPSRFTPGPMSPADPGAAHPRGREAGAGGAALGDFPDIGTRAAIRIGDRRCWTPPISETATYNPRCARLAADLQAGNSVEGSNPRFHGSSGHG